MSAIFGSLNISDTDRVFSATVGQRVIFDVATEYIARVNQELNAAMAIFLERTTEDFKLRYKLPGSGYLQLRGPDGRYQSVKATGQWDVAFPLRDYGAQLSGNDVDMAYMTVAELDRHLQTVVAQNVNSVRFEILYNLFNSSEKTFVDPLQGSLSVEPLANGDAVLYPPVLGTVSEATDNHYLESGYAYTAIDATHNPIPTMKSEIEEHFGVSAGGSNIVAFINPEETPYIKALGSGHFTEFPDPRVTKGITADVSQLLPGNYPGTLIGRCDGVWIVEWRWIPPAYMLGNHLDFPKPLMRRIDPADTGLGDGLQLVARDVQFPFEGSFFRHRFGMGVGNRLNGVVMELGTGGSYTIPTAYQ